MIKCKCGKEYFQRSTLQTKCPACSFQSAIKSKGAKTRFNWVKSDTPKKKSDKTLARERADKWFSRYIRLKYVTSQGFCKCFTCGTWHDIKKTDCGHFIGRSNTAVRYDENNARCQCQKCNRYQSGKHYEFRLHLIEEIGESAVNELEAKGKQNGDTSVQFYNETAEKYKRLVHEIQTERGIKVW